MKNRKHRPRSTIKSASGLLAKMAQAFPVSSQLNGNDPTGNVGKVREYESVEQTHLTYRRCNAPTCFFVPKVENEGTKLCVNSDVDRSLSPLDVGVALHRQQLPAVITFQSSAYEYNTSGYVNGDVEDGVSLFQIEGDPDVIIGGWDDVEDILAFKLGCGKNKATDKHKHPEGSDESVEGCFKSLKIIIEVRFVKSNLCLERFF